MRRTGCYVPGAEQGDESSSHPPLAPLMPLNEGRDLILSFKKYLIPHSLSNIDRHKLYPVMKYFHLISFYQKIGIYISLTCI